MLAILGFAIGTILAIFTFKSPQYFLYILKSIGLSFQDNKRKIDFQDFGHGGHLGFFHPNDFSYFYLQVIPILPNKFGVDWPFVSEEAKNRFQDFGHGSHLGFRNGTILAIFDLQVTPMLPTKFQVNWPFNSGEEAKKKKKKILKMAAMAAILDFRLEQF